MEHKGRNIPQAALAALQQENVRHGHVADYSAEVTGTYSLE